MGIIGTSFPKLETWLHAFSIELFAEILKPSWIRDTLKAHDRESLRIRKLPANLVVWLSISMGLFRTLSIPNVLSRLGTIYGTGSLWDQGITPASTTITEARDRVGFGPLRTLFEKLRTHLLDLHRERMLWKGMLLLALDGTTFKVPDSPQNRRRFGLPGISRGGRSAFPQMRALLLVSPFLRFILAARFGPFRREELNLADSILPEIPSGTLLLADRRFASWGFLLPLRQQGRQFLVRVPTYYKARRLWATGPGDALVEVKLRGELRRRCPQFPRKVLVREIYVRIRGVLTRYWTSLLDSQRYPTVDLVTLYARRWEEEIGLDELKTHQSALTTVNRPVLFRSQTSRRVLQEAWGLAIAYNLIRALMAEAAKDQAVEVIRLSFVDALERVRQVSLLMAAAPTADLPRIYEELLISLGRCRLPIRRRRENPRVVAIKMSNYPKKWKSA